MRRFTRHSDIVAPAYSSWPLERLYMPRGRERQTSRIAFQDSQQRILEALPHAVEKTFGRLQAETGLSATTLGRHLARLRRIGWVVWDPETERYRRTKSGDPWMDVVALGQLMLLDAK